jgi:hypothetical protein
LERLRYDFEHMYDGRYQVRLNGEFVCYTDNRNSDEVDKFLKDNGFDSRIDYLEYRLKQYL